MGHLRAVFLLSVAVLSRFRTCFATTDLANSTSTSGISFIGETSNIFTSCSASVASWLGFEKPVPDDFINNCKAADELLQAAVSKYGSTILEFVPRWRSAIHDLEVIRTPIKFTAGSNFACTITIVNMDMVPSRYVHPDRFHVTDVATFYGVRNALSRIWQQCLYGPNERQVGYALTGSHDSLGVFVYGVHASIAFGMPWTADSIAPPTFAGEDSAQLNVSDVS